MPDSDDSMTDAPVYPLPEQHSQEELQTPESHGRTAPEVAGGVDWGEVYRERQLISTLLLEAGRYHRTVRASMLGRDPGWQALRPQLVAARRRLESKGKSLTIIERCWLGELKAYFGNGVITDCTDK